MKLRPDRQTERQREAQERNQAWSSLTFTEQIKQLDDQGLVATKQRAKIQEKIEHERTKNKKEK